MINTQSATPQTLRASAGFLNIQYNIQWEKDWTRRTSLEGLPGERLFFLGKKISEWFRLQSRTWTHHMTYGTKKSLERPTWRRVAVMNSTTTGWNQKHIKHKHFKHTVEQSGGWVIIGVCFTTTGPGDFAVIKPNMNSFVYRGILE